MILVKRLVLDILKPHHPNPLEFAKALAEQDATSKVTLIVTEMDEKTETLQVVIQGEDIQFEPLLDTITALGGSLHSIDEVEVHGSNA